MAKQLKDELAKLDREKVRRVPGVIVRRRPPDAPTTFVPSLEVRPGVRVADLLDGSDDDIEETQSKPAKTR